MQSYLEEQIERLKQEKYHGVLSKYFDVDTQRLSNGEPYEYVLGYTTFLGCHIDLSLHPMIPRFETAFWVERAIQELRESYCDQPIRLADTFAGAGNVAVALLSRLPNSHVDISELDASLERQIEINLEKNSIPKSRATILTESGLDGLVGPYHAIFAVPPYVPHEALPNLDPEMIHFEPHLAFFAKEGGHEFHRILINTAWDLLGTNGTLYMEADMDHEEAIREMVTGTKWSRIEFWPDPYGATPNVVLRK